MIIHEFKQGNRKKEGKGMQDKQIDRRDMIAMGKRKGYILCIDENRSKAKQYKIWNEYMIQHYL